MTSPVCSLRGLGRWAFLALVVPWSFLASSPARGSLDAREMRRVHHVVDATMEKERRRIAVDCSFQGSIERYRETGYPGGLEDCLESYWRNALDPPGDVDAGLRERLFVTASNDARGHSEDPQGRLRARRDAALCLAWLEDPRAAGLLDSVEAAQPGLLAWRDLQALSAEQVLPLVTRMSAYAEKNTSMEMFDVLASLGGQGVPFLLPFVEDPRGMLGVTAVKALAETGSMEALHILDETAIDLRLEEGTRVEASRQARGLRAHLVDRVWVPYPLSREERALLSHAVWILTRDLPMRFKHPRKQSAARRLFVTLGEKGLPMLEKSFHSPTHGEPMVHPPLLIRLMTSHRSHYFVTDHIAGVMEDIGMEAVPFLIDALCSPSGPGPRQAAESLRRITGEDFGVDYTAWLAWWTAN